MYTISDILADINRGCIAHNLQEKCFSYRLIYFVNFGSKGEKHYIDVSYDGLRLELENIIRKNLSTTNSIVISAVTIWKNGEIVSLLSRSYGFCLSGYFEQIIGEKEKNINSNYREKNINNNYRRRQVQWG